MMIDPDLFAQIINITYLYLNKKREGSFIVKMKKSNDGKYFWSIMGHYCGGLDISIIFLNHP